MRMTVTALAFTFATMTSAMACDAGISDENLQVGPPLTEQQIVAMLEEAKIAVAEAKQETTVEQAAVTPK